MSLPEQANEEVANDPPVYPVGRYADIRISKFVLLSLGSFGTYGILWIYRMWKSIAADRGGSIRPFWRALFAGFTYFGLLEDLRTKTKRRLPTLLAVGYLITWFTRRFPDPGPFAFQLGFLFLIPAVIAANVWAEKENTTHPASRWRWRNLLFLPFAVFSIFALVVNSPITPSARLETASGVLTSDVGHLKDNGLLLDGEQVLWFATEGILSARSEAVLMSTAAVGVYFAEKDGAITTIRIPFEKIDEVEVSSGTGLYFDSVVVIVWAYDGSGAQFPIPTKGRRHTDFLAELDRQIRLAQP